MAGRGTRLAAALPSYLRIGWWGLVTPRRERVPLVVHQAVVLGARGLLLTLRRDLRGWELPGGGALLGETGQRAVEREVLEETGVEVRVERHLADYVRTGFRPHVAKLYVCRPVSGAPRPSAETERVGWFDPASLPDTLLPWFRGPIADALAPPAPPVRRIEHQGLATIAAAIAIDLRMRWRG